MILRVILAACLLSLGFVVGGCGSRSNKNQPVAVVRFLVEAGEREAGGTVRLPRSGTVIAVAPKSLFTEYDILSCEVVNNELGLSLAFQMTPQASRDLFRMTATNQGRRLVTMLNGVPVGARRIDAPFGQGFIVTYVEIDDSELEDLAKHITRTSRDAQKEVERRR